jgi:sugar lactone lactonase YvrE/DNA-binding transcriptional ArsR family regulator
MAGRRALGTEATGQDSRAELFEAIGHPARIKILQVLNEKPLGFADLKRAVGIESSGNLSFHLTKLRHLIGVGADGNYVLTDDGKEALWSIGSISAGTKGQEVNWRARRVRAYRWKILVTSLVIGLMLLGSVVAIQQVEFVSMQAQIQSQGQKLSGYDVQPFVNGQSASIVLGQPDFTSISSPSEISGRVLYGPTQVVFDSTGNLWVVDAVENRILEFVPPFRTGMSASLVIGQQSLYTVDSATTADKLGGPPGPGPGCGPSGAAFDPPGNLWVADTCNNRVLEFEHPLATGMQASIVIGQRNFTAYFAGVSNSELNSPVGPVFDTNGNLWVEDTWNNRVLGFVPPFSNGMKASLVIGQKDFVSSTTSNTRNGLNCRFGDLTIDNSGDLWVGDPGNNRILEFRPPFGDGMNASMVVGQSSFTTNQSAYSYSYSFFNTEKLGVATVFDSLGNLWASHTNRLEEFRPQFVLGMQPSLEIGQPDFTSVAWSGGPNGLSSPSHPGFDPSGNLWVPDTGNNRILEFAAGASNGTSNGAAVPLNWELPFVLLAGAIVAVGAVLTDALLRRRLGQT